MIYQATTERSYGGPTRPGSYAGAGVPIVIDNGSCTFRAGFAGESDPRLVYDNLFARYRNRLTGQIFQVAGNDVHIDPALRTSIKSPYDGAVVTNWDAIECVLDYAMVNMSVDDSHSNPILMTETLSNLPASRRNMTELLFECYRAPSVAYGIDGLFSFHQNGGKDGLVISAGHNATHLVPVFGGKPDLASCKRLSIGAKDIPEYLLSLLQLKYPGFPIKITPEQSVELAKSHCYVSENYNEELKDYLVDTAAKERVVQFPFTEIIETEQSAEEAAIVAQRKQEAAQRLRDANEVKRVEKLAQQENDLSYYLALKDQGESMTKREFTTLLEGEDLEGGERALNKKIQSLNDSIRKTRNRMAGIVEEEVKEEPDFSLLSIPDDQLSEEQIRQKKGQRLMKFGYDARQRAKAEKAKEQERQAEEARLDEEQRKTDSRGWIEARRAARQQVLDRMKDRKKLKAELQDRKSLASQMRMKQLAGLAANDSGKRKRRGDDDNFGASDADWGVYRDVAGEDDSEDEEEDDRRLQQLEADLLAHDPAFTEADTERARHDPAKSLVHTFLYGKHDPAEDARIATSPNALLARDHQIHLNVERIRAPEVLFRPALRGLDQCGVVEIAQQLIARTNVARRGLLCADVFTTGGGALWRGFDGRLRADLTAVLPTGTPLNVRSAKDPLLDAWRGASSWASPANEGAGFKKAAVTRMEYEEYGVDYIKEHNLGNVKL